jgi:6-phosphogluconolactonase
VNSRYGITVCADRGELSAALGALVVRLAAEARGARGRFAVALSGGSLMEFLGAALASRPPVEAVDWSSWHVFWADERWVPLNSPESNYGIAARLFLNHVPIPAGHIHRLDDSLSPSETAGAYESTMQNVFHPKAGRMPRFDLILLGIGEDGHTASLFPGHPVLEEQRRWAVAVPDAPKPPPVRITLTLPVINNARCVTFAAAGEGKAAILAEVLGPRAKRPDLPAAMVCPRDGELLWFIDRAAGPQ